MGCDIHLKVERRLPSGAWQMIRDTRERCYNCEGAKVLNGEPCERCKGCGWTMAEWYEGRNYTLFSLLADVRNDGSVKPIAPERGVPDDASPGVSRFMNSYGGDGHSHSWFTLQELIDYPYTQKIKERVQVTPQMYAAKLKRDPHWREAPGIIHSEGDWIKVTRTEMRTIVESGVMLPKHWTELVIGTPIREHVGDFLEQTVEGLKPVAAKFKITPSDLRICFFFDN